MQKNHFQNIFRTEILSMLCVKNILRILFEYVKAVRRFEANQNLYIDTYFRNVTCIFHEHKYIFKIWFCRFSNSAFAFVVRVFLVLLFCCNS